MSSIITSLEGERDRGAIKGITVQLRRKIKTDLMGGNNVRRLKGLISARRVDAYIILKDLHRMTEQEIRAVYNQTRAKLDPHDRDRTHLVIIPHAIEAWFLGDINAINEVYGVNIVQPVPDPESIEKPDKYLNRLLQQFNKQYIKNEQKSREIIEKADLDAIRGKCPSFDSYMSITEGLN